MFFYGGPSSIVWYKSLGSRNFLFKPFNPSVNNYSSYNYTINNPSPYNNSAGGGPPGGSGSYTPNEFVSCGMVYGGSITIEELNFKFRKKFTPTSTKLIFSDEVDISSVEDDYILNGFIHTDRLIDYDSYDYLYETGWVWPLKEGGPIIDIWYTDYQDQEDLDVLNIPDHLILANMLNSQYIKTEPAYINNFFVNDYVIFNENFSNEYEGLPVDSQPFMYRSGPSPTTKNTIIKFLTLPLCYSYEETLDDPEKKEYFNIKFNVFFTETHNLNSGITKVEYSPRNACTASESCAPGSMSPPLLSFPDDLVLSAPAIAPLEYPKIATGPPTVTCNFGDFDITTLSESESVSDATEYLSPTTVNYQNFTSSSRRPLWCYVAFATASKNQLAFKSAEYQVSFTFNESAYHKITLKEDENGEEEDEEEENGEEDEEEENGEEDEEEENEVVATKIIELKIVKESGSEAGDMEMLIYITFIPPIIKT